MTILLAAWAFVKSPLGRYIALAGVAVALFVGFAVHFRAQGKLEGQQQATDDFLKQQTKDKDVAHADAVAHINADNLKDQQSAVALNTALIAIQGATTTINGLIAQRKAATSAVAATSDGDLHAFTIRSLNLRAKTDLTPGYISVEERAIANAVVDDPVCRQQADVDDPQKMNQMQNANNIQLTQLATAKDRYDFLAGYTTRLEGFYVTAYNAAEKNTGNKFLRVITFGIKGKPNKVSLPDPLQLAQEVQKAGTSK